MTKHWRSGRGLPIVAGRRKLEIGDTLPGSIGN